MTVFGATILIAALFAGILLGGVFYGGLWMTIRSAFSSLTFGVWLLASYLFRTAISLAGIYLVYSGSWPRLIACLIGFGLARFIVARVTRMKEPVIKSAGIGARHAS